MALRTGALVAALAVAALCRAPAQSPIPSAQTKAMMALVESDPELANHYGLFASPPATLGDYGGKLVAAANILTSLLGKRTTPESLNEIASKAKLYSENVYGANVCLDGEAMAKLLSLGSGGRYSVSLAKRVAGEIPSEEAQDAEASSDLYVILAYLDHMPMIERSFAWNPDGTLAGVSVVNPLAGMPGLVPYKAKTSYEPSAIDAWEFYRFRKALR
jgi:hypothetical protein